MAIPGEVHDQLAARFAVLLPHLNERQRRLALAAEARLLGHGGVRAVARAAGVSETTVRKGVFDLEGGGNRSRRASPGGGRKGAAEVDPVLLPALLALVEPDERGDPMSPLRWTTKSLRHLAGELTRQGHRVSAPTVGGLLRKNGFSLQATAKTLEGGQHPDRDAQFRYINEQVKEHQAAGEPVISVDAKKKEQLGQLPVPGREWRPSGQPVHVEDHAFFAGPRVRTVVPYGIYDIAANTGWVNVGIDHDTAAFAAASIRRWWQARGRFDYPDASRLLITADAGGSNSYRYRLWKSELAAFAAEAGLAITVCHFPPGTSKWNKIEHRLFSHITMNWRGRPLTSHEVVLNTIAATTTATGLRVQAVLDQAAYPTGIAVTRDQLRALPITAHDRRGIWNYTIAPAGAAAAPSRQRTGLRSPADPGHARRPPADRHGRRRLDELRARLALAQEARAEQRQYHLRGGRRVATTGRDRSVLADADKVLLTVLYLRQVCPQKVMGALLGINPVTIGHAIAETRLLLDERKISITPAVVRYFTRAEDIRAWLNGTGPPKPGRRQALPARPHQPDADRHDPPAADHAAGKPDRPLRSGDRAAPPPAARRPTATRHPRRRFRQKITDGDRILATILYQRRICGLDTLAELFAISRSTLWNAINDVQPILDARHVIVPQAEQRFTTTAELLSAVETGHTARDSSSQTKPAC